MWTKGEINGYKFYAKHYEEGSEYGIGGNGRISKLEIRKDGRELYLYERGLCFDRLDAEGREVYEQILKKYN
jgi:hypothetical protein